MTYTLKRNHLIVGLLAALALCSLLLIPLNMDFFAIRKIEFSGARIVPSSVIYEHCAYLRGKNIFSFGKGRLIGKLERIPQVYSVTVKRHLPGKLAITITEKKPWINLVLNSDHLIIDSNGYILNLPGANEINTTTLPVVRARSEAVPKPYRIDMAVLNLVRTVLTPLETVFIPEKLNVNLVDSNNIEVLADDILLIKIGNTDDIEEKHAVIKTFLSYVKNRWDTVEYIDVRSASHPVIRFKKGL